MTAEAWVLSAERRQEVWKDSVDRIIDRKLLGTYPETERSKKEIQLEASLRSAVGALANSLKHGAPRETKEEESLDE